MESAIKVAFYRGQASAQVRKDSQTNEGMLAVGLGADAVAKYLSGFSTVSIACFNSPNSITLSGHVQMLTSIKSRLEADGHFARMLHVDHAYHSSYMTGISEVYKDLLDKDVTSCPNSHSQIEMFSSVFGSRLDSIPDSTYWKENMASPVRFDEAVRAMVSGRGGADFLIEVGPSGTLGSPIAEIKATLPQQASHIQYCTAFQRGQQDLKSLFEVAGRIFLSGGTVNLENVNRQENISPRTIVDLPNYAWNHATRYWHESEASKDWRFRLFPPHDLIGSKILGKFTQRLFLEVLRCDYRHVMAFTSVEERSESR